MANRTPVTVVSGSLGAGKTTLVNHLLEEADRRLAVLVNDMGEVAVDADVLESDSLSRDGIAELGNGCICCELQADLATEVRALAGRYDFDHLVVEASGISEPAPVARLFTVGDAAARYTVDALVTVADARLLAETFAGERPERETPPDAEDRPLSDLLVEQLEVSNVVLCNKCDLVTDEELAELEATITALQPETTVQRTIYCEIDPGDLLGICAFDPDALGELAGWQRALAEARAHGDDHTHTREHEHGHGDLGHDHRTPESVYGVGSVTVSRQRPLESHRFASFLEELPSSVVRLKGPCWIAGVDDLVIQVSGAGRSIHAEAEGEWIATLPDAQQRMYRQNHPDLPWDEEYGDRRSELVFIGADLEGAVDDLEACFVDPEAAPDDPGPFPTEKGERSVLRE